MAARYFEGLGVMVSLCIMASDGLGDMVSLCVMVVLCIMVSEGLGAIMWSVAVAADLPQPVSRAVAARAVVRATTVRVCFMVSSRS
jgi:hypothetical protein